MYNPSRGGVRGGADQFTWESVKTDKHRENYLGHSLKAPVGRWQKGKDLSWYAKERKDDEDTVKSEKSEMAEIKRAEEEAMLIALGHKVVRRETQALSKEEMTEALKRNVGDKNDLNVDRVDGVGASSRRATLYTGVGKDSRSEKAGVMFENKRENSLTNETEQYSSSHKKSKSKKKSKKHKKEKKSKHSKHTSESEDSEATKRKKQKKNKKEYNSDSEKDTRLHAKKKYDETVSRPQPKKRYDSNENDSRPQPRKRYDSDENDSRPQPRKRYDSIENDSRPQPKKRYDSVENDSRPQPKKRYDSDENDSRPHSRKRHDSIENDSRPQPKKRYDSNENDSRPQPKKKSKHRHKSPSTSDTDTNVRSKRKADDKYREQTKRRRHDTSESD